MSDFKKESGTFSGVNCSTLKVSGFSFPSSDLGNMNKNPDNTYVFDNQYLKYSIIKRPPEEGGPEGMLVWEKSSSNVLNIDSGTDNYGRDSIHNYLVMNEIKGGQDINLSTNTTSYKCEYVLMFYLLNVVIKWQAI